MPYTYDYEMPAVTADALVIRQRPFGIASVENQILLIERGNPDEPYYEHWALPGGFVNKFEEPADACMREVKEETGLVMPHKPGLFNTDGGPDRDPRGWVITLSFWIIVPWDIPVNLKGDDDASRCQWFDMTELPNMAFDHREAIEKYWSIKPYLTKGA